MPDVNTQEERLPKSLEGRFQRLFDRWDVGELMGRIWASDETVWTASDEGNWLGWLRIVDEQLADRAALRTFAQQVRGRYSHAVLLGMGGSSLCPEVLRLCFGTRDGFPDLKVLDSTEPAEIQACEESIDIESTLFISASKSGSTIETSLLTHHFLGCLTSRVGAPRAAAQFAAITDPGSQLEADALELGFGHLLHGVPSIGGRYSALSNFGMAPAAAMGLDVDRLLAGAKVMCSACRPESPLETNPGLRLGLLLGAAALAGRDKLTLLCSPPVDSLGTWIEQLIAESTGKLGKGIVPVEGEELGDPSSYADDRVFVHTAVAPTDDSASAGALAGLVAHGHPVVRIRLQDLGGIGQEFFRWEVATAVAGAVLGINPFDQPDVESAKVAARDLTASYEADGCLPTEDAFLEDSGIRLFAARPHSERLVATSSKPSLASVLEAHLGTVDSGDYVALLAFVVRSAETQAALAKLRGLIRARTRVATCVGFGPRFLHSTGQLHKGGPDSGVFIQIGCESPADVPAPGRGVTFGVVKHAQALGDFNVLKGLGRRALRVHIQGDLAEGLAKLESALVAAQ